jgi:transcriptional regulator with XRE-family HTH domain
MKIKERFYRMGRQPKSMRALKDAPSPSQILRVDAHVGARVKLRRKLLGWSQTQLANALGVAFQQVQKYERGTNRIAASTLYQIAMLFDVPIGFFFEGLPSYGVAGEDEENSLPFNDPETMAMVAIYWQIGEGDLRQHLCALIKAISHCELQRGPGAALIALAD